MNTEIPIAVAIQNPPRNQKTENAQHSEREISERDFFLKWVIRRPADERGYLVGSEVMA